MYAHNEKQQVIQINPHKKFRTNEDTKKVFSTNFLFKTRNCSPLQSPQKKEKKNGEKKKSVGVM